MGHLPAPSLDVPVLQMVDQLPDIEHFFAALSPDPEQVIVVPKILPLDVPMRAALRVTQLVEQLVEVPTTVSYSSLQRTVEQLVDIPVPGGGGGISGAQGFLPRQSSTALHGSLERISERIAEQNVDPVSRGSPGSSSLLTLQLSPKEKKCEGHFALGVGTASAPQLIHGGGSAGGLR